MDDPRALRIAREWMNVAKADLRTAEAAFALDPPEPRMVAFHAQQAAEKCLKGFLAFHGEEPPRTHALEVLVDRAEQYDAALGELRDMAAWLTGFAVEPRYPFAGEPPTAEEVEEALRRAGTIYARVTSRMPGLDPRGASE